MIIVKGFERSLSVSNMFGIDKSQRTPNCQLFRFFKGAYHLLDFLKDLGKKFGLPILLFGPNIQT